MVTSRTTALQQFARLETTGLWRPAPEAQRREVVVSFGEATLMLADGSGRPLTHWSLPAVERLNPGQTPALYAPDGDPAETLEIDDSLMIEALDKIHGAIAEAMPRPGLLRRRGTWAVMAVVAALAVFWLPGALKRQALSLVPDSTRQEIGATMLGLMQRETGPACRAPNGRAALERMSARLFGAGSNISVVVLPGGLTDPVRLPGGLIVMPRSAVAATDDPFVFAGDVVVAHSALGATDPLRKVLDAAGLRATLTLLATGRLSAEPLAPLAHRLLTATQTLPNEDIILAAFDRAGLPIEPWAMAQDVELNLPETEADEDRIPAPVMSDADWISIQSICIQ